MKTLTNRIILFLKKKTPEAAQPVRPGQPQPSQIRPSTMGVLREGAYENKPNVLLSTGAYLYRRGA
jgi:hypothetical protein